MAKKSDLVNNIAHKLDYVSKEDIGESVSLVLEYLKSELAQDNRIEIRGFGTFSIRKRKYVRRKDEEADHIYKTIYYRQPKDKKINME